MPKNVHGYIMTHVLGIVAPQAEHVEICTYTDIDIICAENNVYT